MRKTILGLGLALLLAVPCGAAETVQSQQPIFTDITDSRLLQTASVLNALGIMQGTGERRFSPNTALTRAQFCKIAVTSMGFTDVNAYRYYTIFPDVKSAHWASQYINAAVRHPELKKQAVICGYADGTFRPDKNVNYGEACTMLLRMLGYTEEDIGPFWPIDYIAKAQDIGLTEGVTINNPTQEVSRQNAAIMLLNTLNTSGKGEEAGLLLSKVASETIDNCILLETSETSSDLTPGEALFFEENQLGNTRKVIQFEKNMVGMRGMLVIGKDQQAVVGIVPDNTRTEQYMIKNATETQIETQTQTLRPEQNMPLYLHTTGQVEKFSDSWTRLQGGNQLTVYYDKEGKMILMAVLPDTSDAEDTIIYDGSASSINLPDGYHIFKNGEEIDYSQLQTNDVITVNHAAQKVLVSDVKLTGYYTDGTPSLTHPQKIKMYGVYYNVSEKAAYDFTEIEKNDSITVLFDINGKVAKAYLNKHITAPLEGKINVVDSGSDRTITNISLDNGLVMENVVVHQNSILLETSDTSKNLKEDEAIFFDTLAGGISSTRKSLLFDKSMVGTIGTLIVDGSAVGMLRENTKIETYTVQNVSADEIETTTRTLNPDPKIPLYIHGHKVWDVDTEFSLSWTDWRMNLNRGDTLTLYYNKYGELILMAVLPDVQEADYTVVYGIASSVRIPDDYQIIKNGAVIDRSKLQKYDVMTVHNAEKKILVSDKRISSKYLSASPSFTHPEKVTLYGMEYEIPDDVVSQFSTFKRKDNITLLFDAYGKVAAVYPKEEISAAMEGIVIKADTYPGIETLKGTVTVLLTNGLLLKDMKVDTNTIEGSVGYLVYINQDEYSEPNQEESEKGKAIFYKRELYSEKVSDDWEIPIHALGNKTVSSTVALFEQAAEGAPLVPILQKDLPGNTVSKSNIKYTLLDSSGSVICMVLEDVTDEPWMYGIASGEYVKSTEADKEDSFKIRFTYWDDEKKDTDSTDKDTDFTDFKEYPTDKLPIPLYGNPVMISKGYSTDRNVCNKDFVARALIQIDTVNSAAFDNQGGVRTKDGYYDLRSDDMPVYITDLKEYKPLRRAKADYNSFALYADKKAEDGGKICMIVVP